MFEEEEEEEEEEEGKTIGYCVDGITAVSEKLDGKWQTSAKLQNLNFLNFSSNVDSFCFFQIFIFTSYI